MEQLAVGGMPHAGGPFVQRVVNLVILALQFPVPLPAEELPQEIDPDVLFGVPIAEPHAAAVRAEGLIDQRGGGRPVGRVERHFVQRCQDALERNSPAHEELTTPSLPGVPNAASISAPGIDCSDGPN